MARHATTFRMQAIIGLPALVLATSCVPHERSVAAAAAMLRRPDPATLLRRLALDVPSDLAAAVLPAGPRIALPLAAPSILTAPPFVAAAQTPTDNGRAADCLTAAVYYEARSQALDGQRAVAQVVLNRVRDRAYPGSVCGVVFQGSTRQTGCQFSFTCDGSMDRPREPGAWARARAVADAALGGDVYAPVGAATSYHATSIVPWWASSLARVATIGAHVFYRWRGGLERVLSFRRSYAGIEPDIGTAAPGGAVVVHAGTRAATFAAAAVTVHRGGGDGGRRAASPVPVRLVFGVRVHLGVRSAPAPDRDAAAIVSAERDASLSTLPS